MILGRHFFVTPSDSVAVIAANAKEAIPYFKDGLKVGRGLGQGMQRATFRTSGNWGARVQLLGGGLQAHPCAPTRLCNPWRPRQNWPLLPLILTSISCAATFP